MRVSERKVRKTWNLLALKWKEKQGDFWYFQRQYNIDFVKPL